mmetsp:Transcript_18883/g.28178  ORF Transcript_18883/g.28178 Transcript_18883/m.28178 type:complete len:350 (-) Transcript_18883:114-1163(-)
MGFCKSTCFLISCFTKSTCLLISCCTCLLPLVGLAIFVGVAATKGYAKVEPFLDAENFCYYTTGADKCSQVGYPVFSDRDGSPKIAAIEQHWNKGIIIPPLQGWLGMVNPRQAIFLQDGTDSNSRIDLMKTKSGDFVLSLFYMETSGYLLVNYLSHNKRSTAAFVLRIAEDGGEQEQQTNNLLNNKALGLEGAPFKAIPSRDGSLIAGIAGGTYPDNEFNVVFVDALTMDTISTTGIFVAEGFAQLPHVFWADDSSRLYVVNPINIFVQDETDTAFDETVDRLADRPKFFIVSALDGTVEKSTEDFDGCIPYPTSSGRVRVSDGSFVDVDSEANEIAVSTLEIWNTCVL